MGRAEELFDRVVQAGEAAIDEFIDARTSEELFLDFKRSADNGRGTTLHQNDRSNFEKAVSGFGNSVGGVIIWGVDCSRNPAIGDVASAKVPIEQPTRFKSWLENATSGVTVPPHGGVRHWAVGIEGQATGFVASLIPTSQNAPHQTTNDKRYYMRAGSSFMPVPHGVLAGMFGRRPNPYIKPMFDYRCSPGRALTEVTILVSVCNEGLGIAEHVFANVSAESLPGEKCSLSYTIDPNHDHVNRFFTRDNASVVLKDRLRLPPGAQIEFMIVQLAFQPPFNSPLRITMNFGCEGSPTNSIVVEQDRLTIENAFDHVAELIGRQTRDVAVGSFLRRVFGV